ncbi:hypothetical protein HID58_066149, partial [Brassica napus]
ESSAPSTVVANPTSTPLGATAQDVASATVPSSQEAIVEPEKANHSEISPKSTVDTEKGPIEPASETLALTTPKSDESWKQKPPPPKTPSKPTHIYVQKAGPPVPLLAS